MTELFAASLTSVRGPDLHAVLQPFVRDVLIVDIHLERNRVFLLSIHVLQHGCDEDGCETTELKVNSLPEILGLSEST